MHESFIDLPWLPRPARNFRQQIRVLQELGAAANKEARHLASYALTGAMLDNLGKAIAELAHSAAETITLGVLSNGSTDFVLPALVVGALRHGLWLRVIGTEFDQVGVAALDLTSKIHQARCDFILLGVDYRGLPLQPSPGDAALGKSTIAAAIGYVDSCRRTLRKASGSTVILQTIPQVPESLFGSLERSVPGTTQWLIDHYNHDMRALAANSGDLLLDVATLAEVVGLDHWHDPAQWYLGKFPFAQSALPLYSDWTGRLLAAARGKARKCLVLDLDNTIWGGVVGDDGLAGLVLGSGSPDGEAFLKIQQTALELRNRGIILAVSSKNDERLVREVFRSHPEMLLREEHIAIFQVNWIDKASNLSAIASSLNIGIDTLVLLDDNPAERAQVRAALPAVAVPELPTDPALFSRRLLAGGYFEALGFTAEDQARADLYRAKAIQAEELEKATDIDSHLASLEMRLICSPFDPVGRSRIAQLINKSNQFNLTTRRYTEAQVAAVELATPHHTFQLRLIDRFADNGIIAVVICTDDGPDWVIDTWLMSCRVLNRTVEQATLDCLVARAKAMGVHALIGEYRKTARNEMVADHYVQLGFSQLVSSNDITRWKLEVASYVPSRTPIIITDRLPARTHSENWA